MVRALPSSPERVVERAPGWRMIGAAIPLKGSGVVPWMVLGSSSWL